VSWFAVSSGMFQEPVRDSTKPLIGVSPLSISRVGFRDREIVLISTVFY